MCLFAMAKTDLARLLGIGWRQSFKRADLRGVCEEHLEFIVTKPIERRLPSMRVRLGSAISNEILRERDVIFRGFG